MSRRRGGAGGDMGCCVELQVWRDRRYNDAGVLGEGGKAQSVDAWLLWGLLAAWHRGASGRKQGQGGWGRAGHGLKDRGSGQTSEGLTWRLRSLVSSGRPKGAIQEFSWRRIR